MNQPKPPTVPVFRVSPYFFNEMAKLAPPKEQIIQAQILKYLKASGITAWRANTGAVKAQYAGKTRFVKFGVKGQPDIMGVLRGGRFLALEVKRPGQPLTTYQAAFLAMVRKLGAVAAVVHSVEEVQHVLWEEQTQQTFDRRRNQHGRFFVGGAVANHGSGLAVPPGGAGPVAETGAGGGDPAGLPGAGDDGPR